ncbi:MAG: hypothetical protein WBD40_01025 [Tepidisphaeraceae bacterium]
MKPNPTRNFWSIGAVADHASVTKQELERVADELGVAPILWLNGVPFFSMLQAIPLAEEVEHRRSGAPRQATDAMRRKVARAAEAAAAAEAEQTES